MSKVCVILDSNFLMIPEIHGVDIFSELDRIIEKKYDIIIPEVVIGELRHLRDEGSSTERKAASVALELVKKFKKISSQKSADEEIIRLARKKNCAVGTNDRKLKNQLRKESIPVIYLRQKSHLEMNGVI